MRLDSAFPGKLPGIDSEDGCPGTKGEGDFGERAILSTYGDHGLSGTNDEDVPGLAQTSGQGKTHMRVGVSLIESRQESHREASGSLGSAAGSFHHPA
jgi:hypothetical protein